MKTSTIISVTCFTALSLLAETANAHVNGAGECRTEEGEYPKVVNETLRTPVYIVGSQRGDVILTRSGGNGPVVELLTEINQNFSHAAYVSSNGSNGTRITQATSLNPGMSVIEKFTNWTLARFDPDYLAHMMPGNESRRDAYDLLYGKRTSCLNSNSVEQCMAWGATPKDLHRGGTILLRPTTSQARQGIDEAEGYGDHHFSYGLGGFSDFQGLWNDEDATICSGLVTGTMREAGNYLSTRYYSRDERATATVALFNNLHTNVKALMEEQLSGVELAAAKAANVPAKLAAQITNCFVAGGESCGDFSHRDSLEDGDLNEIKNWVGSGYTMSPDNLMPRAEATNVSGAVGAHQWRDWADVEMGDIAGGKTYTRYSHLECCKPGGTGAFGEEEEECRKVYDGTNNPSLPGGPFLPLPGGPGPSNPGPFGPGPSNPGPFGPSPFSPSPFSPSPSAPTPNSADSAQGMNFFGSDEGVFVEYQDEICYETNGGKVCSVLPQ